MSRTHIWRKIRHPADCKHIKQPIRNNNEDGSKPFGDSTFCPWLLKRRRHREFSLISHLITCVDTENIDLNNTSLMSTSNQIEGSVISIGADESARDAKLDNLMRRRKPSDTTLNDTWAFLRFTSDWPHIRDSLFLEEFPEHKCSKICTRGNCDIKRRKSMRFLCYYHGCPKTYLTLEKLNNHQTEVHHDSRPFFCLLCKKRIESSLFSHDLTHVWLYETEDFNSVGNYVDKEMESLEVVEVPNPFKDLCDIIA